MPDDAPNPENHERTTPPLSFDGADAADVPVAGPVLPEGTPIARPVSPHPLPVARPVADSVLASLRDPLLLSASTRKQALGDMAALMLCLIALESTIGAVVGAFVPLEADGLPPVETMQALLFPMIAVRSLVVCLLIPLILRHRRQTRMHVGLHSSDPVLDIVLGLIAPVAIFGLIAATMYTLMFLWPQQTGEVSEQLAENTERLLDILPPLHPVAYVGLAILIGFYEELLFRGFLLPRLRRLTGSWALAVLLSTALFTLLHAGDQTPPALVMVTILSLVFSVLTIWRRSIIPAIIAHALWDLSQFLLLRLGA